MSTDSPRPAGSLHIATDGDTVTVTITKNANARPIRATVSLSQWKKLTKGMEDAGEAGTEAPVAKKATAKKATTKKATAKKATTKKAAKKKTAKK